MCWLRDFFFFLGVASGGKRKEEEEEDHPTSTSCYVSSYILFALSFVFVSFCFCRFVFVGSFRFVSWYRKKKKNNNKCRSCTLISFIHFSTLLSHVFGIKISTCKRRAFRKDIFDSFQNQTDPCASLQASNGSGVPKSQFPVLSRFYVTQ